MATRSPSPLSEMLLARATTVWRERRAFAEPEPLLTSPDAGRSIGRPATSGDQPRPR